MKWIATHYLTHLFWGLLLLAHPIQAQWPIGIQQSSMKGSANLPAMVAQLKQWGVTELEGGWPGNANAKAYRKLLNENGLRLVGLGADFKQLQDSLRLVTNRAKQLRATYVVCYWIPHGEAFTLADADKAIAVFTKAGQYLRQQGLTLCYHNHGYEFVEHGQGTLFDYLAERIPTEVMQFELDLMWAKHTRQGASPQDPVALLKKYPGRFPLVHLKDRRPATPLSVQGPALKPANVVLGQGDINLSQFLQEARRSGVKHLFIEDESLNPMVQIPQSIAFLRNWETYKDEIRLLVRADDLGMAHSANRACLDALKNGIARSVEVMAPTPWCPEALTELSKLPTVDVGVHLTLTSEWPSLRWRPLTQAPSLTDSAGYFYPTCWKGTALGQSFTDHELNLAEIETELRAQIEQIRKKLPRQLSHLSVHMAFDRADPRLRLIVEKLSTEYGLPTLEPATVEPFPKFDRPTNAAPAGTELAERERAFAAALDQLSSGTYLLITHPAYHTDELKGIGDQGVTATVRDADAAMLQSEMVKTVIGKRKIKLVSYRDILSR